MDMTLEKTLSAHPTELIYCGECAYRNRQGYCALVKAHTPDSEFCKDGARDISSATVRRNAL